MIDELYLNNNLKKLKKFNYFSSHLKILRIFGLWYYDNENNYKLNKRYNYLIYLIFRIIFLSMFAYLFTILEIIQLFISNNNFDDFINNLCYAIVHVMACSKITLIIIKANDLKRITSCFGSGIFQPKYQNGEEILKKCYNRTEKLLKIYFIIGTSVVTNGLLCPLYISPSNFNDLKNFTMIDDDYYQLKVRKLPYVCYFPFDVRVSPNYEIAYVYQGICLMTLSPLIVTIDVLYGSILLHIAAQLRILGISLINIKQSSPLLSSSSSNIVKLLKNNYFNINKRFENSFDDQLLTRNNLNHCINHHQAIIRITEEMENMFSPLVLLQFLCNLVIMCFPLFQITTVPVMSFPFFSMVSLMAAMMYQLFIFCNCGDEVNQQSLLVANYAYFIDWYNLTDSYMRRAVIAIIQRSQKPLRLTVAKFALLSRETYLKVVQGSASYFMFLRKARGK